MPDELLWIMGFLDMPSELLWKAAHNPLLQTYCMFEHYVRACDVVWGAEGAVKQSFQFGRRNPHTRLSN